MAFSKPLKMDECFLSLLKLCLESLKPHWTWLTLVSQLCAKLMYCSVFSLILVIVMWTPNRAKNDILLRHLVDFFFFSCLHRNKYSFWFWWQDAVHIILALAHNSNCSCVTVCEAKPRFAWFSWIFTLHWITSLCWLLLLST